MNTSQYIKLIMNSCTTVSRIIRWNNSKHGKLLYHVNVSVLPPGIYHSMKYWEKIPRRRLSFIFTVPTRVLMTVNRKHHIRCKSTVVVLNIVLSWFIAKFSGRNHRLLIIGLLGKACFENSHFVLAFNRTIYRQYYLAFQYLPALLPEVTPLRANMGYTEGKYAENIEKARWCCIYYRFSLALIAYLICASIFARIFARLEGLLPGARSMLCMKISWLVGNNRLYTKYVYPRDVWHVYI